ncbi:ABC transporter permease [Nocardia seriolae]|uniref:ABC transporter permease n=1 Tax=Nocardia seriolae TaxID=37332 RepID=UPI000519F13D|nr:ABC transporter permease subunit [Nocardia seriolae]MTJ63435.1 ABC transporter permease subunit [Nocardia seriolae]MTJ70165.1 ABC transporter permease subunit [Nocardia seriolae]MTJ88764.1 ABC transporter permease subunit [Nocardia seriolae]MTK32744.1 ABC transporter permease subunit [Nocardia seriolae]MTK41334.1 ABC transporter permease subunit [Nocardia seriolae]
MTRVLRTWLPPVLFGVVLLVLWQVLTVAAGVPSFLLPAPSAIAKAFGDNHHAILEAALATGKNALAGLLAGAVLGIAAAIVAVRFRVVDGVLGALAAGAAAVPIVALAPLLNSMYSTTTDLPRRLVATIVVFFPVFVSAARGLRQVSAVHADLMHAYAATGWQITRTVRLPAALPHLFTGLRIAAPGAVIAAIIAEYFGGLQHGLGSRITSAAANTAYPRAWAYVVAAMILGLVFLAAVLFLEQLTRRPRTILGRTK